MQRVIENINKMKSKHLGVVLVGSILLAQAATASAQFFTPGDLVVTVYGSTTSSGLPDGAITPITLQEYSLTAPTSASLVFNDQLPTTGTGANVGIVGEYGSSSEGTLSLTADGRYLTIGGYSGIAAANGIQAASNSANSTNFAAGTAWSTSTIALAQSAVTDVPRVFATIDANNNVNTSTVLNDVYNTNNPRGSYSPDGSTIYISGQGASKTDEGGLYRTTIGTNTTTGGSAPTGIFNAVSTRSIVGFNGNLYYSADQNSSKKGTQTGIFEYSGFPTTSQGTSTGTRITPDTGVVNGTTVNFSPQGFAFASSTILYVADTGDPKALGTGDGGIQKWVYNGSAWTLAYTLTNPNFVAPNLATSAAHGETGFAGLTLRLDGNGNADIYAVSYTAADADPNGLYGIVDNLGAATLPTGLNAESFVELAAGAGLNGSASNVTFKGVSFAPTPEPSTASLLILAGLGGAGMVRRRGNVRRA